jgi:hypothetical protein
MEKDGHVVKLPNVHRGDVGVGLLKMLIDEAGMTSDEWTAGQ